MNNSGLLVIKAIKLILKTGLVALELIAEIASDKPSRPRYSPTQAKILYDEGRISNAEYGKSFYSID